MQKPKTALHPTQKGKGMRGTYRGRPRVPCVWKTGVLPRFFQMIEEFDAHDAHLTARAGIAHGSLGHWRAGRKTPQLLSIEAVLNVMGYELAIRRKPGGGDKYAPAAEYDAIKIEQQENW